jgi:hypothetical protein
MVINVVLFIRFKVASICILDTILKILIMVLFVENVIIKLKKIPIYINFYKEKVM